MDALAVIASPHAINCVDASADNPVTSADVRARESDGAKSRTVRVAKTQKISAMLIWMWGMTAARFGTFVLAINWEDSFLAARLLVFGNC